ncbi:MAG: hypothetical protein O2923_12005 [Verrucomicrobia bacterium]|nr:hypothetical protein [Verrucomicrobiota bacterium]MDA1087785.1 hypothetical protein [Verrucomicrobiota bacterium]
MTTLKPLVGAGLIAAALATSVVAQSETPSDDGNQRAAHIFSNFPNRYLLMPHDLKRWHTALHFQNIQRAVTIGTAKENVKIRRMTAHLGVDILDWLTIYGAIGMNEFSAELATRDSRGSSEETWTAGLQLRLIEYYLLGGGELEDRLVVDINARIIDVTSAVDSRDVEWEQTEATLRFGLVNEIDEDRGFVPEEIMIWVGPVTSSIEGNLGSGRSSEIQEQDNLGFAGGIDVRFNRHASLVWDAQLYDEKITHDVGLKFNF